MAIDPASKAEFEQAPLRDMVVGTDLSSSSSSYVLPGPGTFDPRSIEIIVDLDLDEMLLYFNGRNVPHDVEPLGEMVSYLVESGSDRVVGVIIHEFMSRAVREHPQLSQAMRWAIIVSGDTVQPPSHVAYSRGSRLEPARPWNRIHDWLLRRLAEEGRERTAETVQSLLRTA